MVRSTAAQPVSEFSALRGVTRTQRVLKVTAPGLGAGAAILACMWSLRRPASASPAAGSTVIGDMVEHLTAA